MTPVFCCGFECGLANPHWTLGANATFVTSNVRSGARALRIQSNSGTGVNATSITISTNKLVIRGYFRVNGAIIPSSKLHILSGFFTGNYCGAILDGNAGGIGATRIYAGRNESVGATGIDVVAQTWYRLDVSIDMSANPWLINVSVDGVACGQATNAAAANTMTNIFIGSDATFSAKTCDINFDDIIASSTLADFPLGAGYINHFVPTSDGTHNVAGTADFQRTLTGTDILNATTTAFQLIDDVPLESGASVDWINMIAPPNATDYVECIFGPASGISTPTVAPRAVDIIAGYHQAGATAGNMEIRMNDNGTTNVLYTATGVIGVTTVAYARKHYAANIANGGAWTLSGAGNFNNLRVRFGSPASVDANPDQYLDCIMIEAEFDEFRYRHEETQQPYFGRTLVAESGQKNNIKLP